MAAARRKLVACQLKLRNVLTASMVVFARTFLQSCGMISGEAPFMRGTVQTIEPCGKARFATVLWDGAPEPKGALVSNLWPLERRHLEPV
jgi:hypothetical protein